MFVWLFPKSAGWCSSSPSYDRTGRLITQDGILQHTQNQDLAKAPQYFTFYLIAASSYTVSYQQSRTGPSGCAIIRSSHPKDSFRRSVWISNKTQGDPTVVPVVFVSCRCRCLINSIYLYNKCRSEADVRAYASQCADVCQQHSFGIVVC